MYLLQTQNTDYWHNEYRFQFVFSVILVVDYNTIIEVNDETVSS